MDDNNIQSEVSVIDTKVVALLCAVLKHQQQHGGAFAINFDPQNTHSWTLAYEFGTEADDAGLVAGAAYGVGPDLRSALAAIADDLGHPETRSDAGVVELPLYFTGTWEPVNDVQWQIILGPYQGGAYLDGDWYATGMGLRARLQSAADFDAGKACVLAAIRAHAEAGTQ